MSLPTPLTFDQIVELGSVNADLLAALKMVIPYMESAEAAGLVGHEGCHWPVEIVRAAIARATGGAE
jgi:hypothetical protein